MSIPTRVNNKFSIGYFYEGKIENWKLRKLFDQISYIVWITYNKNYLENKIT